MNPAAWSELTLLDDAGDEKFASLALMALE
jgi:hypothetical protein